MSNTQNPENEALCGYELCVITLRTVLYVYLNFVSNVV